MGETTKIEWCDSTCNLLVGCDGCELSADGHCYAEQLVRRYAGKTGWPERFDKPALFMDRLAKAIAWRDLTATGRPAKPWLNGRPRMIFLNDLGDMFSTPALWRDSHYLRLWGDALGGMADSRHTWLILTKRPKQLASFVDWYQRRYTSQWPHNVWGGTSVTSQATAGRIAELLRAVALPVRFVSCEPMLGPLDLLAAFDRWCQSQDGTRTASLPRMRDFIHWIIAGGESGPGARPCHPAWIRKLQSDCELHGVPFFFKQWGEWTPAPPRGEREGFPYFDTARGEAGRPPAFFVHFDGSRHCFTDARSEEHEGATVMVRVGKAVAGRLLDGHQWNELPLENQ